MDNIGYYILSFFVIYVVVFVLHYFFLTKPAIDEVLGKAKKKSKKVNKKGPRKIGEVEYLVYKFKLDRKKLNYQSLKIMIPLLNSFIITFVTFIIELIPVKIVFKLLIGFVLLTALIYAIYEIYGRHLLKVEKKRG